MVTKQYKLTRHAEIRCQQRGIRREVIDAILNEADRVTPAGSGAHTRHVSRKRCGALVKGGIPPQTVERLASVYVVTAGSLVVTVFHNHGRQRRRNHRRR